MRTPRRSAARNADQRNADILEGEQRGVSEFSDRTTSEPEGATKVKAEAEDQPEETNEPETVDPATYKISTYHFNKASKRFGHLEVLPLTAKEVKTIFAFRAAVVETRRLNNHMVKVVIAEGTGLNTTYEIADSDDFSDYFDNARNRPEANDRKQLIGLIYEGDEAKDFQKVVDDGVFLFV